MRPDQIALVERVIRAAKTLGISEHRQLVYGDIEASAVSNNREHLEKLVVEFHKSFL